MDPMHAAVNADGLIIDLSVMTAEVAQIFREGGWVELMWPGCTLVDATEADPRPEIGWTWNGQIFAAPAENPEPEPEPEPEPDPEPTPEPPGDEPAG